MSVSHVFTRSWKRSDGSPVNYEKTVTSDTDTDHSQAYADGTVDQLIDIAIDFSRTKGLFIGSDQDVTLETNNPGGASGTPDQTFNLKANCPIEWTEDDVATNPITVDITAIYITNDSGETANVEIHNLYDATP